MRRNSTIPRTRTRRHCSDWFERIAETERALIDLERAVRFDKLGVQDAILRIEDPARSEAAGGGKAVSADARPGREQRKLHAYGADARGGPRRKHPGSEMKVRVLPWFSSRLFRLPDKKLHAGDPGRWSHRRRSSSEQTELSRALAEAGTSPVDFIRALENHLAKYPDSPQRAVSKRRWRNRRWTRGQRPHHSLRRKCPPESKARRYCNCSTAWLARCWMKAARSPRNGRSNMQSG